MSVSALRERRYDKPRRWLPCVPAMPRFVRSFACEVVCRPREKGGCPPGSTPPRGSRSVYCGPNRRSWGRGLRGSLPRNVPYTRGNASRSRTRMRVQRCSRPPTGRQMADGPRAVPLVAAGTAVTTHRDTASAAAASASVLPPTTHIRPHPAASTTADPARGSRAAAGTWTARPGPPRHLRGAADSLGVQGPAPPGRESGPVLKRRPPPSDRHRWGAVGAPHPVAAEAPPGDGACPPARGEGQFGKERHGPVGEGSSGPGPGPAGESVRRYGGRKGPPEPVKPDSRATAASGRTALTEAMQLRAYLGRGHAPLRAERAARGLREERQG